MDDGIHIRPMTAEDVSRAVAIAAAFPDAPHWPRSGYEAALEQSVWPRRIALVAQALDSTLAGFLIAALLVPQFELESIAVAAPFQRTGVAGALMAAAFHQGRQRGCSQMLLEVRDSNLPARGLYRKLGFRETGRRNNYYRDPAEAAILMELVL